jgi:hypothetical protein
MGKKVVLTGSVTAAGLPAGYAAGGSVGANTITMSLPAGVIGRGRLRDCVLGITPASGNFVSTGATINVWVWKNGDQPAAVADAATISTTPAVIGNQVALFQFTGTSALGPLGTTVAGTSQAQHMVPANHGVQGAPFDFAADGLALTADRTFSVQLQCTGTWDPGAAGTIAQTVAVYITAELDG